MSAAHPERLPWFAHGTLDGREAASIEEHVRACADCQAEVDALRSMTRSLRHFARLDHVAPERLVAYHTADPAMPARERRAVERHVRQCAGCSADVRSLARADVSLREGPRWRPAAAAASILLMAGVGWGLATLRQQPAPPAAPTVTRLVLEPTQRGAGEQVPAGEAGAVELEVWLPPLGGATPIYVARVRRLEDPPASARTIGAGSPKDGHLVLRVAEALAPGRHELTLTPAGGDASQRHVYRFELTSPP